MSLHQPQIPLIMQTPVCYTSRELLQAGMMLCTAAIVALTANQLGHSSTAQVWHTHLAACTLETVRPNSQIVQAKAASHCIPSI